jgi:hypothetical protein
MAEPFASSTTLTLDAVSAVIQEQYFPQFVEQINRAGSTTNRLFQPRAEAVVGDGEWFQNETAPSDTVRANTDMLANDQQPRPFTAAKIKVRFNQSDPSTNDFTRFTGVGRVDMWTLENGSGGTIIDIAQRVYMEIFSGYNYRLAMLRNADRTARIATTSTKTNSDGLYSGGCSAYTTGSTTCRLVITAGSIAALAQGSVIDIYTTAGVLVFSGAQVISCNPADPAGPSLSLARANSSSTANFDNVTTGQYIYFSGEINQGMYSMGAWFSRPTSTDSFIGGVNRFSPANQWLVTTATREGQTARLIQKADFDALANAMNFIQDGTIPISVAITDIPMNTALREAIGNDALITWPSTGGNEDRYANFGSTGLLWQHPAFGKVSIVSDPLAVSNSVRFMVPDDWIALTSRFSGLHWMPGTQGVWNRMVADTPNTGYGYYFQCDAVAAHCDYCKRPRYQGQILNVTSS